MIFNPYQLPTISTEAADAASRLTYAVPLLQDNTVLVALMLTLLALDVLTWAPKGVMRQLLGWITDTRSDRAFEESVVTYPWTRLALVLQLFLCTGLIIYCVSEPDASFHLCHPSLPSMMRLGVCMMPLVAWVALQIGLLDWSCYIFDMGNKLTNANHAFLSSYLLVAPLITLLFIGHVAGVFSPTMTLNLLAALFILSQAIFIFTGIKIFYQQIWSILPIFVYLCALEIAPLLVLWVKFVSK